jgi:hypothetical protein
VRVTFGSVGPQGRISRLFRRGEPDIVVLTVVPNEAIAGMMCSLLASEGIEAAQKSAGGALPYGGVGGERMILIPASAATRAKKLIESLDPA